MAGSPEAFPQRVFVVGLTENQLVFSDESKPPRFVLFGIRGKTIDYCAGPMGRDLLDLEIAAVGEDFTVEDGIELDQQKEATLPYEVTTEGITVHRDYPGGVEGFARNLAGAIFGMPFTTNKTNEG